MSAAALPQVPLGDLTAVAQIPWLYLGDLPLGMGKRGNGEGEERKWREGERREFVLCSRKKKEKSSLCCFRGLLLKR